MVWETRFHGWWGTRQDFLRSNYGLVLDAGCGIVLAGHYLKLLVNKVMIEVDASRKMLDIADKYITQKGCSLGSNKVVDIDCVGREEPLYDNLLVLDLEEMTLENTLNRGGRTRTNLDGFNLVMAADVLVYFGDLSGPLERFA